MFFSVTRRLVYMVIYSCAEPKGSILGTELNVSIYLPSHLDLKPFKIISPTIV